MRFVVINSIVSIIMPVYNGEKYIEQSINSVLMQTYKDIELIICDNESTDNTINIINNYKIYSNVKIVNCTKRGVSYARNKALSYATGKYIAFLDGDDLWYEKKLEYQIDFMKKYDVAFCYSSYDYINESSIQVKNKKRIADENITYKKLLKNNSIGTLTVVIDKEKVNNINFKDIKHEDMILWLQLLKTDIKIKGIKKVLASYRISRKSLSSNKIKAARWRYEIYRKVEKFSVIKSVYYFVFYTINAIKYRI